MATTHSPSRRQRPSRRTTASMAHARHRSAGARQNRPAPETTVAEPPVWDEKVLETKVEEVLAAKAARPIRTPDSDDHLAAYFRQLAEHELLTPEDERELSQGIEDTEILTWEHVFARPEIIKPILALVEPNLEQPVHFAKLVKHAEDLLRTKKTRTDSRLVKKFAACARESAQQLRTLDLDRVHIDAVVRELYRAREAALAGQETWWVEGTE